MSERGVDVVKPAPTEGGAVAGPAIWMLVALNARAATVGISSKIALGSFGSAVLRVNLPNASVDLLKSAKVGVALSYQILYRERYVSERVMCNFATGKDLPNVAGRSADLAFALAFACTALTDSVGHCQVRLPAIAATGMLGEDGGIRVVDGLREKFAAAINVLPAGSLFVFPGGNEKDMPLELVEKSVQRGIALLPAFRLEEVFKHLGIRISRTWLENPFRGLEPFEFEHASIFFGRNPEVDGVLGLLARRLDSGHNSVLVTGASGSGKSSLVLAGVLPALLRRGLPDRRREHFRWGLLRMPAAMADIDPQKELAVLNNAFESAWAHDKEGGLGTNPSMAPCPPGFDAAAFVEWLHSHSSGAGAARLVLVLDQLEAWFTAQLQPETLHTFGCFLAGLAEHNICLLGTLTNAAQKFFTEFPEFSDIFGIEGEYALDQRLDAKRLQSVILEPAEAAGLSFDPGLEAEILVAASHGGSEIGRAHV